MQSFKAIIQKKLKRTLTGVGTFKRVSNYKALTGKIFGVLDK